MCVPLGTWIVARFEEVLAGAAGAGSVAGAAAGAAAGVATDDWARTAKLDARNIITAPGMQIVRLFIGSPRNTFNQRMHPPYVEMLGG
jgi:hypothetical protein